MTGEEDRYSKLDLWSIQPNLEGSAKIVDILRPTLTTIDKDYLQSLDDAYASVTTVIDKYGSQSTGFKTFDQISAADLKTMQAGLANLSELLVRAVGPARPGGLRGYPALMDEAKVLSRRRFLAGSPPSGRQPWPVAWPAGSGRWRSARPRRRPRRRARNPATSRSTAPHQAGIVLPTRPQTAAIFVTLDAVVGSKPELATTLAELTARSRHLTAGLAPDAGDPLFPPPESGILGPTVGPSDLTITVGFGASLFDDRFGLADRIPRQLVRMPDFRNDRLQAGLTHGDLLLQICATDEASCLHALRYLMLGTRGSLVVRWLIHGFQQRPGGTVEHGGAPATRRNLLGFKDGTANLAAADPALMDELVWVGQGQGEPDWAVGGTYFVARTIRMFVERWDRTALGEQEAIIGRTKRTGTPLGKAREHDDPAYGEDPNGERIALDAHIRLANPRTPETRAAAASSGAATPTAAGSTARACSTRACSSSPSSATSSAASWPSRTGCRASRSRSTSSRSAAATSSRRRAPTDPMRSGAPRSWPEPSGPRVCLDQAGARPEAPVGPEGTGAGRPPHTNRIRTGIRYAK